jgi:hypothetical protein
MGNYSTGSDVGTGNHEIQEQKILMKGKFETYSSNQKPKQL